MAKKMFNTDEFDALFDDASESSDMFSGLFSENINPDTEKVTDPNEIVKGGDVDPDGKPDVKSSFESLFEDDDEDDKPAEGEGTDEDDKPAEGEGTDEDDKPAEGEGTDGTKPVVKSSFESLFEDDDDDDSAEGEDSEGEADDGVGDSEDLDSDLFENFIL